MTVCEAVEVGDVPEFPTAPSLAGVTVPRVVYVIGHGSSPKKLELAVIGFDGKRYVLHTTVGANSHPKFGPG